MKLRKVLCAALALGMVMSAIPANVQAADTTETAANTEVIDLQSIEVDKQDPMPLNSSDFEELLSKRSGIQPYVTVSDDYEPNDTFLEAYPYDKVEDLAPELTRTNQLFTLGYKHAGFHSATDEDWFSINLTKGTEYFVDLRNIGRLNWYIELYYIQSQTDGTYRGIATAPILNSIQSTKITQKNSFTLRLKTLEHIILGLPVVMTGRIRCTTSSMLDQLFKHLI